MKEMIFVIGGRQRGWLSDTPDDSVFRYDIKGDKFEDAPNLV